MSYSSSSSVSSNINSVPNVLLQTFVSECIQLLQLLQSFNNNSSSNYTTLSQLRQLLLQQQQDCLSHVVSHWNNNSNKRHNNHTQQPKVTRQQVQEALRNAPLHSQQLDHAARLAFARLVLTTRFCMPREEHEEEETDGACKQRLQRADLLEFCGLCLAAVQLPMVQQYLAYGKCSDEHNMLLSVLGEEESRTVTAKSTVFIFPHERLERIQVHFWRALDYNTQVAKSELQRLFFQVNNTSAMNEFTNDPTVQTTFGQLVTAMEAAIVAATHQAQEYALRSPRARVEGHTPSPTTTDDSTTRVVAVQYSESLVVTDPVTGDEQVIASSSPSSSSVQSPPTHTLPIAAEQLQQEIWAELLSLRDEQRQETLKEAAVLARHVQETALQLSNASDRKQYLQSIDVQTQKQLVMHKLWHDWIQQQHKGVEPAIRFQANTHNVHSWI